MTQTRRHFVAGILGAFTGAGAAAFRALRREDDGWGVEIETGPSYEMPSRYFPMVHGAGQQGNVLVTDGWPPNTEILHRGDIFQIAEVYAKNPMGGKSTGCLKYFAVTAEARSDKRGRATLQIWPPILNGGGYFGHGIDSPADNAMLMYDRASLLTHRFLSELPPTMAKVLP